MSRSRNSRRGSTNKHAKRHRMCSPGCSYCHRNITHSLCMEKARRAPIKDEP
jgi:hypothetical protein